MNMQYNTQALVDLGRAYTPAIPGFAPRDEAEYARQVTDLTFLVEHAVTGRQSIVDAFAIAISARQRGFPHNESGAAA